MKVWIAILFFVIGYASSWVHILSTQQEKPVEIVVDTPTKRCIISTYKPHSFESSVKRTE